MPKFLTIGYGDEMGYNQTPEPLRTSAHAADAEQMKLGALMSVAKPPTQVRNPQGRGIETTTGPYMSSALPIAGFSIIDAASLPEAIEIASKAPCAVCYGVVEVWPLDSQWEN